MSILQHSFDKECDIMLEAYGGGSVNIAAFSYFGSNADDDHPWPDIHSRYVEEHDAEPSCVSLRVRNGYDEAFTDVDARFLEPIAALKELILPDTVTKLDVTPKLEQIFQNNKTLIRGPLDSFAERFAHEHGLRFRPDDIDFDYEYFKYADETTYRTLMFLRDGSVIIRASSSSPGSNGGNTFGGDFDSELPQDFYNMTFAEFVDGFPESIAERVRKNESFAAVWDKFKTHDIYWENNE